LAGIRYQTYLALVNIQRRDDGNSIALATSHMNQNSFFTQQLSESIRGLRRKRSIPRHLLAGLIIGRLNRPITGHLTYQVSCVESPGYGGLEINDRS
jgi:hypothetical protein